MIAKLTRPSIARAAILPVACVLAAIAGLAVVVLAGHNRANRTASLLEKVTLTARVIAPIAAAAVWRFDTQSGARILQSLAFDPDFGSGIIVDDKGQVFASFQDGETSLEAVTPKAVAALLGAADPNSLKVTQPHEFVRDNEVMKVLPLFAYEDGTRNIGYLALSFSRGRDSAAARGEIFAIVVGGLLALLTVSVLLGWILSRVTRPIREMTVAMGRLSAGEFDTAIPALDRRDEIGAMARALAVFKENSIERQRLEFLTKSLQQTTEDLQRETEKVAHLAHHDTMTGLANRASFMKQLNQSFAAALRTGLPFAVMSLDLDHFKDVNDTLGHPKGDLLLQSTAKRLKSVVRKSEVIGRLGGDEFAILVKDASDLGAISVLAQRINRTLAKPYAIGGNQLYVSASIGISVFGPTVTSSDEMMIQADLALYQAKQVGRKGFCFHSSDLDTQVRERMTIAGELHLALERNELELYYQPQVEILSGRISGLEALVRWNHPTRGLLMPAQFLPIAEVTGMIVPLGNWVLEESCRQLQQWSRAGVAPPLLAINFAVAQLKASPNLDREIMQVLNRYGVAPSAVELEVTEHTLMEATEAHSLIIERIRALGVGIAIDDFGTGYSSLASLRAFPFSRLKIAQQFVCEIATNPGDAAIVRATIGLARELGIGVVAEGVETVDALRMLEAAGCRCAQGYYFSPPVPAGAAEELLRHGILLPQSDIDVVAAPASAPDHVARLGRPRPLAVTTRHRSTA
jgi:diguanylate cyclase (GGDEF)-like protein